MSLSEIACEESPHLDQSLERPGVDFCCRYNNGRWYLLVGDGQPGVVGLSPLRIEHGGFLAIRGKDVLQSCMTGSVSQVHRV